MGGDGDNREDHVDRKQARAFEGSGSSSRPPRCCHLDALRAKGLTLATPDGTSTLDIPAVAGPAELGLREDDVLLLATKTQDAEPLLTDWAWQPVRSTSRSAAEALPVVCAQNGVASERIALRRFRHVYGMCVWMPATHLEPGAVEASGSPMTGLLHLGRYPSGTARPRTRSEPTWRAAASWPRSSRT
jgi:2-dehydropantoate 2-reductase